MVTTAVTAMASQLNSSLSVGDTSGLLDSMLLAAMVLQVCVAAARKNPSSLTQPHGILLCLAARLRVQSRTRFQWLLETVGSTLACGTCMWSDH